MLSENAEADPSRLDEVLEKLEQVLDTLIAECRTFAEHQREYRAVREGGGVAFQLPAEWQGQARKRLLQTYEGDWQKAQEPCIQLFKYANALLTSARPNAEVYRKLRDTLANKKKGTNTAAQDILNEVLARTVEEGEDRMTEAQVTENLEQLRRIAANKHLP